MIGWLIALSVLLLLWILPIGICVVYNENGFGAKLIAGPVRIRVFPLKKKDKKKDTKKEKKEQKTGASKEKKEENKKNGGSFTDFLPLVNLVLELLGDFRRKIRVNQLQMKLIMGGGDPCDLAVNYGRAWIALGNLMPQLERLFVIKKRDLEVACDFTSADTKISARLDLTITIGRILSLGVWHGLRLLKEYLRIMNQRKGGVKNESKSS